MTYSCMLNLKYPFNFKYRDEYADIMKKKEAQHEPSPSMYGTTVSNLIAMMLIWDPASRPNIDQVITQLNKVDEEINPRA